MEWDHHDSDGTTRSHVCIRAIIFVPHVSSTILWMCLISLNQGSNLGQLRLTAILPLLQEQTHIREFPADHWPAHIARRQTCRPDEACSKRRCRSKG